MPNYTSTGAGDATCNDTWLDNGDSSWTGQAHGKVLSADGMGGWFVGTYAQPLPQDWYYFGMSGNDPTLVTWQVGVLGTGNAPTFTAGPTGHSVAGTVTHGDTTPYEGVTLTAVQGGTTLTAVSGSNGAYQVAGCADGQWTLTPSLPSGDLAPHNMTSDSAPSPYVASASSEVSPACQAFNGNSGNDWTAGATTGWLKIDLGAASQVVSSYAVETSHYTGSDVTPRSPKTWTLQGSSDGTNWTTLDTQTSQTGWTAGQKRTFTIGSPGTTAYRYLRLNITANNGDSGYLNVCELYLYYAGGTENWSPATRTPTVAGADVTGQNFTVQSAATYTGNHSHFSSQFGGEN